MTKQEPNDFYLMGVGGTGMGAFAGLLKEAGFSVRGSDNKVYSPMKEKLAEWQIPYKTPYSKNNLSPKPDLVIVGNVIRKDNEEAVALEQNKIAFDSFPSTLRKLFLKNNFSIVASGTHGKTTCSALLAHVLHHAKKDPGFLIGGIPLNFGESFCVPKQDGSPFVVEGDEYDTAFFDKRPKFIHYDPKILLTTSLEFDHADIYRDTEAIIDAFVSLYQTLSEQTTVVVLATDQNIKTALERAKCRANIISYGEGGDFEPANISLQEDGTRCDVRFKGQTLGSINIPLYGRHNLANALGVYAALHDYGLTHQEISAGFKTFVGVKRRLEERLNKKGLIVIDDFAHHPSAVFETIRAAKQKYPGKKIVALFEPRSQTSCRSIFNEQYKSAFCEADQVLFAPLGRKIEGEDGLDVFGIAKYLNDHHVKSGAHNNYDEFNESLCQVDRNSVLLFMSNGDFGGVIDQVEKLIS